MNKTLLDNLIERTIVPSFSSVGARIRKRLFNWSELESYDLQGHVTVITGGTSGIGKHAALLYAQLGATLVIVGRDKRKTELLVEKLKKDTDNESIFSVIGDLGLREDVHQIASEIASRFPIIHILAHNAGALFNTRKRATNGTDLGVELMVSTPFLLTGLLLPQLIAASTQQTASKAAISASQNYLYQPARVLTMSSGGMYTESLTVSGLEMDDDNYQGAQQYARAKRAQVVLNEMWAERVPANNVVFHSLHPGWVKTPGITEALPGFSKILSPLGLLRTPREGADSLVWLSADKKAKSYTGKFWHDRAIRAIDMSNKTRQADTPERRARLWLWCENKTDWHFGNFTFN
ncbi:MAG: dehydrogenase/reductase SDR family protein 12 [Granulosicoccus sp.]|jgi:NAD(P)-dependent dehydrogenase (short-subunit alcohol dehydrogenase family)